MGLEEVLASAQVLVQVVVWVRVLALVQGLGQNRCHRPHNPAMSGLLQECLL
jgi:hypothetical protein